jgi:aspartyl protease family protein
MYRFTGSPFFQLLFIVIFLIYGPITSAKSASNTGSQNLIFGGIVLHADPYGHYRGTVLINNHPFPFLIDTGATRVSIPRKMAYIARLTLGEPVQISTANGTVRGYSTRLASFKIGTAQITNLDAFVSGDLEEILIGMSALKFFRMNQNLNTLTLTLLTQPDELAQVGGAVSPPPKPRSSMIPKKTWEKTVTCDNDGLNCKTSYR